MERVKMTVEMEVTVPQGLTLQTMFEYWNILSSIGGSRMVSFYADGDGSFHPKCKISFDKKIPELTDEIRKIAVMSDKNDNRKYDFDRVGWYFVNKKEGE